MDFKKEAARKAFSLVQDNSTISLGAGSTIAFLVQLLAEEAEKGLNVTILTPSFTTRQLLEKSGFAVRSLASVSEVDIAFDGCDQMDKDLHALKSGGGIHTHEKLLATMARQFVLIGDEGKYVDAFDTRFPLVVEILPEALSFVPVRLQKLFPSVKTVIRMGDKKDGAVVTDNGNYLLDLWFKEWPELSLLDPVLKSITGLVETSLFYNLAHKAILGGENGVRILKKGVY